MSSEHENPWWIGAPSQYEELRPEVVKLCQEWRDEDGDPSHLADWLFAMLDVAVKRTERDTAAVIHARYERVALAEQASSLRWSQDLDQPLASEDASYAAGRAHASEQAALHIRAVVQQ